MTTIITMASTNTDIIVVDRLDLDTQITATFNAADVPNMVGVATRQELQTLLGHLAGDVSRQADARSQSSAGHHAHQSAPSAKRRRTA